MASHDSFMCHFAVDKNLAHLIGCINKVLGNGSDLLRELSEDSLNLSEPKERANGFKGSGCYFRLFHFIFSGRSLSTLIFLFGAGSLH